MNFNITSICKYLSWFCHRIENGCVPRLKRIAIWVKLTDNLSLTERFSWNKKIILQKLASLKADLKLFQWFALCRYAIEVLDFWSVPLFQVFLCFFCQPHLTVLHILQLHKMPHWQPWVFEVLLQLFTELSSVFGGRPVMSHRRNTTPEWCNTLHRLTHDCVISKDFYGKNQNKHSPIAEAIGTYCIVLWFPLIA